MNYKITIHTKDDDSVVLSEEGESLLSLLASLSIPVSADCGGNGKCGKCKVFARGSFLPPYGKIEKKAELLACRAYPSGDCSVYLDISLKKPAVRRKIKTSFDGDFLGIAFDIGTTGICAELYDMKSGELLSSLSEKNEQASYGADIMSRLSHEQKKLTDILINQINSIIGRLCPKRSKISKIVFAANTVMSHYIKNLSTDSLTSFPFVPADTFGTSCSASELGIKCKNATAYIAPALGSFVGGDISAGIYATRMTERKRNSLLIDIGTNGEIALFTRDRLFVASAAAGPAFEGAELCCGMQASPGAVISYDGKHFGTFGNKKPAGISGSGAIDIMAHLLSLGVIDKGGRLLPPDEAPFLNSKLSIKDGEVRFNISDNVFLSSGDIRRLQLAKAAIRACLDTLLKKSGVTEEEIDAVFLAGAFGTNIKPENAIRIGLIPRSFLLKCVPCGNAAQKGASLALLSSKHEKALSSLKEISTHIELSDDEDFKESFLNFISM